MSVILKLMQPDTEQPYWQPGQNEDMAQDVGASDETAEAHVNQSDEPITWQASEYIQHDKAILWYVSLTSVTVILVLVSIFLIKSYTFAALLVVMAVSVAILAGRPPRVMRYSLSNLGLHVDDKFFGYHDFRAFGVVQDGPVPSIVLIPIKRFMPAVNVYFPSEQGEEIVDFFGAYLPMEHIELDLVEKLARRLRF